MKTRSFDPIGLVESAYDLKASDPEWIARLLAHVAPGLDGGFGVAAFRYELPPKGRLRWSAMATLGVQRVHALSLTTALRVAPRALAARMFDVPSGANTAGEVLGVERFTNHPLTRLLGHTHGMHDLVSVVVAGLDGKGVAFTAAQRELTTLSRRDRGRWAMCGAHFAAALRLRAQVDRTELIEAVLEADGRVAHAQGAGATREARASLEAGGRAMDRARGSLRHVDADAALRVWRGLVDGRWSLVEQIESDGRRYLIARRNEPWVSDPRALSVRERHVAAYAARGYATKQIAYELGLARSTVAGHLMNVLRKLGLRSRAELAERLATTR